jgi:hypothetical protein
MSTINALSALVITCGLAVASFAFASAYRVATNPHITIGAPGCQFLARANDDAHVTSAIYRMVEQCHARMEGQ